MTYLNNKNNSKNHLIAATSATTISVLTIAIMLASTCTATSAAAQQTTTTTAPGRNTTTATSPSLSGIRLSPKPIYQERSPPGRLTPINETHGILIFNGTSTITLPNSTQTINATHNGTAIISFATTSGYEKETIRAEDGETVIATSYEIEQFNDSAAAPQGGPGKGIVTAVFQTNSTGTLAPLNGMILAGVDDLASNGDSHVTLWKWESGTVSSSNATSASNNSTGISSSAATLSTTQGETSSANNNSNTNALTTANEGSPSSLSPPTPSSLTTP
jgi:hypothetical protein